MNLRDYLKALTTSDRDAFVRQCGITLGFLRKAISIGQPFSPHLCVAIEQATDGQVCRWNLRPNDWRDIWPELAEHPDAPPGGSRRAAEAA